MIQYKNSTKILENRIHKKRKRNIQEIYSYLDSRNYEYYIKPIEINKEEEIYPFLKEFQTTKNDRAKDLLYRAAILHNKSTEFQENDMDKTKELYETTVNILNETYDYYFKLQDEIEEHIYMSPEELLLMENISKVYYMINTSRHHIEKFYQEIENKPNTRVSRIHGNLSLDHIVESEEKYLISWNYSRIDSPVIDFVKFYRNEYLDLEFSSLYDYYQSKYPYQKEEIDLFFSLINIPEKLVFTDNHFDNTIRVKNFVEYIDKTIGFTLQKNEKNEKTDQ